MDDEIEEIGLYYYGARYYNPRESVWLSTDPLSGYNPIFETEHYINGQHNGGVFNSFNHNTYGYTYQNPVVLIDPNGKQVAPPVLLPPPVTPMLGVKQNPIPGFTPARMPTKTEIREGFNAIKDYGLKVFVTEASKKAVIIIGGFDAIASSWSKMLNSTSEGNKSNQIGAAYEDYLVKELGGVGGFKSGGRQFDGAFDDVWYEAKVGGFWEKEGMKNQEKWKSNFGQYKKIAEDNGKEFRVYSENEIPQEFKTYFDKKGIKYSEKFKNKE